MAISIGGGLRITQFFHEDPNDPTLVTQRIDPNDGITNFTYTSNGNLKTVEDALGNVTTYTYAEEIDSPLNPKHRNLVRKIQPPTVTVDGAPVTYDPTEFQYDTNGNLTKIISILNSQPLETVMTYATDGLVTSITDRNGNTTEFVYEGTPFTGSYRRLQQIKVPKGLVPADGFRTLTLTYGDPDNIDNVTEVTDDLNHKVKTEYDSMDRVVKLTDGRLKETDFTYIEGLLKEIELPANSGSSGSTRTTAMTYDDRTRLTEVKQDISASTQQTRVKYVYDVLSQVSQLIRKKDGNDKAYSFFYDQFGRLEHSRDPLDNDTFFNLQTNCLSYSESTSRGIERHIGRDLLCRVTEVKVGDPLFSGGEEILEARELRQFAYDELGRMTSSKQTRPSIYGESIYPLDIYNLRVEERSYLYDELSRLGEMTYEDGKTMSWEYDSVGNATKVTDSEGKVTEYSYYRDNLLHQITVKRPSQADRVFTYTYDAAGRLDQIVYPSGTGIIATFRDNADTAGSGFDENGNILFLRYEKNGGLIRRFEWTYDDTGNRETQLDVTPSKAVKWAYGYDRLDRLETVKKAEATSVGGLGALQLVSIYSFDESDNRIEFQVPNLDEVYTYAYNDADRITSRSKATGGGSPVEIETFQHDDDGNMTSRTDSLTGEVISYKWDEFDRLMRIESDTTGRKQDNRFGVNGLRKRKLDKNGNSSTEHSVGITSSTSFPHTASSAAPVISYISGHILLGAEIDGSFRYHLTDALTTVRDVVDDSGTVVKSFEFDEYGRQISTSGSGSSAPKTYVGGLSVNDDTDDSGLYLMGHRFYEYNLGRFLNRDPIGFDGGLNLFSYSSNNPVTTVDPTGLEPIAPPSPLKELLIQRDSMQVISQEADSVESGINASFFLRSVLLIPFLIGGDQNPEYKPDRHPWEKPDSRRPDPPCWDDEDEDDLLFWRGRLRRAVTPKFRKALRGPDVNLSLEEFQELILDEPSRFISTDKTSGYNIYRINEPGGRELQFIFDPKPHRGKYATFPGSFVTVYGTGRRR